MSALEDKVLDHDYDGIREYDNPLPPWWVNLFYITIVIAFVYLMYYHVFEIGDRSVDEFRKESDPTWNKDRDPNYVHNDFFPSYRSPLYSPNLKMAAGKELVVVAEVEKEIVFDFQPLTDNGSITKGKEVFLKNCIICHGSGGEGGIGPNLTDDYWIHGNGINNVMRTITKGVPEKGMLAWGKLIKMEEIHQVASFVLKLHGTNPPNGKAPQGTLVKE